VRRAPVEAVQLAVDPARVPGVRGHALPAAPVGGRPRLLVEVAAARTRGAERRPREQLTARFEVDEVEDLAPVRRVDPRKDTLRPEDDHDRPATSSRTAAAMLSVVGSSASSSGGL